MNFSVLDTYAAAFAAVFGGVGVKIFEKLMSKRSEQFYEASTLRDELRAELTALRTDIEERRKDVDVWREKYYQQAEENLSLHQVCEGLRSEIIRLQNKIITLQPPKAD